MDNLSLNPHFDNPRNSKIDTSKPIDVPELPDTEMIERYTELKKDLEKQRIIDTIRSKIPQIHLKPDPIFEDMFSKYKTIIKDNPKFIKEQVIHSKNKLQKELEQRRYELLSTQEKNREIEKQSIINQQKVEQISTDKKGEMITCKETHKII